MTSVPDEEPLIDVVLLVCKIPLLARRTRPMQPVGQARRATIGYLVYNGFTDTDVVPEIHRYTKIITIQYV